MLDHGHQSYIEPFVKSWYGEWSPAPSGFAPWCEVRVRPELGLGPTDDGRRDVLAFSLEPQRVHIKVRQALVESWLRIGPDDLVRERSHEALRPELREPWEKRACKGPLAVLDSDDDSHCMIPETIGALLRTMVQLLNQALFEWSARVELDGFGGPSPNIVNALDLQLLAYLDRGVAARICANDRCGRWFVHQRGRSRAGQQRDSGVMYCEVSCARAAAQRAYRGRRARAGRRPAADSDGSSEGNPA